VLNYLVPFHTLACNFLLYIYIYIYLFILIPSSHLLLHIPIVLSVSFLYASMLSYDVGTWTSTIIPDVFDLMTKYPSGADSSGRAVLGVGLRPLSCWDCGFETRRKRGCLSLVNVVCCQLRRTDHSSGSSPTECGVSECDREASTMRRPWHTRGCCAVEKENLYPSG